MQRRRTLVEPTQLRIRRREFLQSAGAAGLVATGLGQIAKAADTVDDASQSHRPVVGVHIAAHSFYDEGIDHCLDFLQQTAGVNTLLVTSNSYYGAMVRPKEVQGDHGVPIRDGRGRKITRTFFQPHGEFYSATSLRHRPPQPGLEYAGREIFNDLAEPARRRGMKIHERIYEPGGSATSECIENWEQVCTVDAFGQRGKKPCWNHPDYLNWVGAWLTDLFRSYPIDGVQFGAERNGPLSRVIDWPREKPTCFCEFCHKRAKQEGIDFERARQGLTEMYRFIHAMYAGQEASPDGALVDFLRILMNYPEILAWESMHYRMCEQLHALVKKMVKAASPSAQVGRHIDHAQSSWDLLFRAAMPYARMAEQSEYLKISTYHDILGPRFKGTVKRFNQHLLRQASPEQVREVFLAMLGHDGSREPTLAEMDDKGFSPEYVYREIKRAVDGVAGKAAIYAGIAIDVPRGGSWGTDPWPSDPAKVYQCVRRAFDAGADGIVICREYEEMRRPSLRAVGRAVGEMER